MCVKLCVCCVRCVCGCADNSQAHITSWANDVQRPFIMIFDSHLDSTIKAQRIYVFVAIWQAHVNFIFAYTKIRYSILI